MPLYNQPNLTSGIDTALISTAQEVPSFPIMLLVFVWIFIFIGGSSNQKKRLGSADYPFWSVLAGLSITFLSLLMTISIGIIDLTTLGVVISITIMSALWFFLSKQRGEQ